ncbi:hypothetical protein LUW74_43135 [Actinomadura madurae]|uniref:hypothetical protein n=1 Tax=Actinomadura madurae TaxID=1993 RepID=UPI00202738B6|nr:hypothetical protein [Actinomadura madurae]URN09483.1 hypothetical protein LUW74_43135 [Actinomadura madurae]
MRLVEFLQDERAVEAGRLRGEQRPVGVPAQQPRQVRRPHAGRDGQLAFQPGRERVHDQLVRCQGGEVGGPHDTQAARDAGIVRERRPGDDGDRPVEAQRVQDGPQARQMPQPVPGRVADDHRTASRTAR